MEEISAEIAKLTERGAAFVTTIESGSESNSGAGGGDVFVNPKKDPTDNDNRVPEAVAPSSLTDQPTVDNSEDVSSSSGGDSEEGDATTVVVVVVSVLFVVAGLIGILIFVVKKRHTNPYQETNEEREEEDIYQMEMTSSPQRLSLDGMNRRERLNQMKSRQKGSIEVRDNPMNLLQQKIKHNEMNDAYDYNETKIQQQRERQQELPQGWESAVDEDGDEYYYNHDLNESTYDRPCPR